MTEQKITREVAMRLIDSVDNWAYLGRTYAGSLGLINILVSADGSMGGMRERDTRIWNVECYIGRTSLWQESYRAEYGQDSSLKIIEDLFKKVESKYSENYKQIGTEELVTQTITLLRKIKAPKTI